MGDDINQKAEAAEGSSVIQALRDVYMVDPHFLKYWKL